MKTIKISEIYVNEKPLELISAVIVVNESGGWIDWVVKVEGADQIELNKLFANPETEMVALKMLSTTREEYSGKALTAKLPNEQMFKGTGELFGN